MWGLSAGWAVCIIYCFGTWYDVIWRLGVQRQTLQRPQHLVLQRINTRMAAKRCVLSKNAHNRMNIACYIPVTMIDAPMIAHLNKGILALDLSSYVFGGGGGYIGTGGLQVPSAEFCTGGLLTDSLCIEQY